MHWAEPAWLILLILLPLPWLARRKRPGLAWPALGLLFPRRIRSLAWLDALVPWLEAAFLVGVATSLARPQSVSGRTRIASEGVAIALVLDRSSSMNAADFPDPEGKSSTRWQSAKRLTADFIESRPRDLIGLVAFANFPDLTCPMTLDHAFVLDGLRTLRTARADDDGTNLGDAIVWATETLRATKAERKRMILLSDGRNAPQVTQNHRPIDPSTAAGLARDFNIAIDTIAIGDTGGLIREAHPQVDLDIVNEVGGPDLELLGRISLVSGGQRFQVRNSLELSAAFAQIDALERSSFEERVITRFNEEYPPVALASLCALIAVAVVRSSRGRVLP